jgi:hypothetical protein
MHQQLAISHHAQHRQARRNISVDDIHFVLANGQRLYCAGAMHVFLGRRDLPGERHTYQRYARLEGTVLVLRDRGSHLVLITVYRDRQGLRAIKAKAPYDRAGRRRTEKARARLQA